MFFQFMRYQGVARGYRASFFDDGYHWLCVSNATISPSPPTFIFPWLYRASYVKVFLRSEYLENNIELSCDNEQMIIKT